MSAAEVVKNRSRTDAFEKRRGARSTILTSALGVQTQAPVAKTLLGQ